MPAHLCQLNSFTRVTENGRSCMYRPTPKVPMMPSASSQCSAMATAP